MKRAVLVFLTLGVLVGCSSSKQVTTAAPTTNSSVSSATPGGSSAVAASPTAQSANDLAKAAGCTDIQTAQKAIATDSVFCMLGKVRVEVAHFATNSARDQYVALGKQAAAGAAIRQGDRWCVDTTTGTVTDLAPFGGSPV